MSYGPAQPDENVPSANSGPHFGSEDVSSEKGLFYSSFSRSPGAQRFILSTSLFLRLPRTPRLPCFHSSRRLALINQTNHNLISGLECIYSRRATPTKLTPIVKFLNNDCQDRVKFVTHSHFNKQQKTKEKKNDDNTAQENGKKSSHGVKIHCRKTHLHHLPAPFLFT